MANRFLSNVKINDAYTFPASDGANGQAIITDGAGNLSFGDVAGGGGSNSASVIYRDNFVGDGLQTQFTLERSLTTEDQSQVFINGVYQQKDTYTVVGDLLTFSTAPASGYTIEVMSITGINTGPTTIYQDNFTGNGSLTTFTLEHSVDSEVKTMVFLNGVYQFKNTYSISGTSLTFDAAPANGVAIEVMTLSSISSFNATNPQNGDLLVWNSTTEAWENTKVVQSIQFDGGTGTQGTMSWNSEDETVDLIVSPDVTYQLGQELGLVVRNLSGQTINNGDVVKVIGASGNKVTIDLASNTGEYESSSTFAVVTETIANNSTGRVTMEGLVRGLDTSTFTEGVAIWLGANGQFTATKPLSPNHLVHVGWVVRSHATEGIIFVKISNGWEMEELHDVLISSVADKDLLSWNNTLGVWENTKTLGNITTGDITATGGNSTQWNTAYNYSQVGHLPLAGGALTGNLGVGESTPLGKIHIKGSDIGAITPSAQGNLLVLEDAENGLSILSSTAGAGYINFGDSSDNDAGIIAYDHSANTMSFWTNAGQRMRINSDGNIGVNGNSVSFGNYRYLTINGNSTTQGGVLYLRTSDASHTGEVYVDSSGFHVSGNNANQKMFLKTVGTTRVTIDSSGYVGIGNTNPTNFLTVSTNLGGSPANLSELEPYATVKIKARPDRDNILYIGAKDALTGMILQSGTTSTAHDLLLNPFGGYVSVGTTAAYGNFTAQQTTGEAGITINSSIAEPPTIYLRDAGGAGYSRVLANNNLFIEATKTGFGTNNPGAKLEVYGSGNTIRLDSSANQPKTILFRNVGTSTAEIKTDGNLKLWVEDAGRNIYFDTSGGNKVTILDGGNVGIGTTSPENKLHIEGTGIVLSIIKTTTNTGASVFYSKNDINNTCEVGTWGSARTSFGVIEPNNGYLYANNGLGIGSTVIKFGIGANITEAMRIHTNGYVGIGTTNPSAKLDVNGTSFFRQDVRIGLDFAGANTGIIKWNSEDVANPNALGIYTWADAKNIQIGGLATIFRVESTLATERARIDGDGLKFNGDTAAANALDDYEKGTWTPQIIRHDGTIAATHAIGTGTATYVKIGRFVYIKCFFFGVQDGSSNGSSYWRINGVPFLGTPYAAVKLSYSNMPCDGVYIGDAGGNLILSNLNTAYSGALGSGREFMLTLSYETN